MLFGYIARTFRIHHLAYADDTSYATHLLFSHSHSVPILPEVATKRTYVQKENFVSNTIQISAILYENKEQTGFT